MKKLPITDNPWIQAYQMRNFELGVMQYKAPWIYAKYINCYYNPKARTLFDHCISASGRFFADDDAMLVQLFLFKKQMFELGVIDFVEWAIDLIDNGWYIMGYFDEYFIKAKQAYGKYHFRHGALIYGYDEEQELFYAVGYVDDTHYTSYTFTFEEYKKALWSDFDRTAEQFKPQDIDRIEFNAVKENPDYKFEFNLKETYIGICDYLNSVDSFGRIKPDLVYGIDCERAFVRYIRENPNSYLDIRYSRFFMELKDIMVRRLEYLISTGTISSEILEEYKNIAKMQSTVHLLFIKYELRRKEDIPSRAANIMETIIDAELKVLPKICEQIYSVLKQTEKGEYL